MGESIVVSARKPVNIRPSIEQVLSGKISMLTGDIPIGYGNIESAEEALAAAAPPPMDTQLRITIVWDNKASTLDLSSVLDHMRETGAAMVVKVENLGNG